MILYKARNYGSQDESKSRTIREECSIGITLESRWMSVEGCPHKH